MGDLKDDTNAPPPQQPAASRTTPSIPEDGGGLEASSGKPPPSSSDAGAPQPASYPFRAIDLRYVVDQGLFLTQCVPDASTQYVWTTRSSGADAFSRFADPAYPEPTKTCGTKTSGAYPIVLTWAADGVIPEGTFVAKCVASGVAEIYRVTTAIDGHPAATYAYPENHPACP
jgi:hypothetical protein